MNSILFLLAASLFVPQGEGTKPKQDLKKGSVAQKRRPVPMPIPKAIVKYRGETKIRIDGALDEWPPTMPLILRDTRQVSGTALGAYHGLGDISGQLYMLWDEQYLYLALQVLDDWHHGLKKNAKLRHEIPPVDNAMITFDPKRDTRGYGDDPGRREDRTFYFAQLEEVGDKLIVWNRLKGAGKELAKGANSVVDRRKKEESSAVIIIGQGPRIFRPPTSKQAPASVPSGPTRQRNSMSNNTAFPSKSLPSEGYSFDLKRASNPREAMCCRKTPSG